MKRKKSSNTVRRSVALPRRLVEEVTALAPPELRQNLNRLVTVALKEFADRQKALEFEKVMAEMATDPGIKSENAVISTDFAIAETDGLKND